MREEEGKWEVAFSYASQLCCCSPTGSSRVAMGSDNHSSSCPRPHVHTGVAQVLPSSSDAFSDALSEEIKPYHAQTPGQPHRKNHRSKTKGRQEKVPSKPVQASHALVRSESNTFSEALSEDLSSNSHSHLHRGQRNVNHSSKMVQENLTLHSEGSFGSHSNSTMDGLDDQPDGPGELEGMSPALPVAPKKRKGLSIPYTTCDPATSHM